MQILTESITLRPSYGESFIHVDCCEYGRVKVWTSCYRLPTYLVKMPGYRVYFLQFDNEDLAEDYFLENKEYFAHAKIIHINGVENE